MDHLLRIQAIKGATYTIVNEPIRPRIRPKKKKVEKQEVNTEVFKSETVRHKFVEKPIHDFDFYYEFSYKYAKRRYDSAVNQVKYCRQYGFHIHGALEELALAIEFLNSETARLEKMKEVNAQKTDEEEVEPEKKKVEKEPLPNVSFDSSVVVKKKKVQPFVELHKKYYSKNIRPPIKDKIIAYHRLGYPNWFLEKVLESHNKQQAKKPEIEKFINSVFSKYDGKKTSKPVTRSLLQEIWKTVLKNENKEEAV